MPISSVAASVAAPAAMVLVADAAGARLYSVVTPTGRLREMLVLFDVAGLPRRSERFAALVSRRVAARMARATVRRLHVIAEAAILDGLCLCLFEALGRPPTSACARPASPLPLPVSDLRRVLPECL